MCKEKSVKNKNQYSQSGAGDATFSRNLKRATAFERKRKGEGWRHSAPSGSCIFEGGGGGRPGVARGQKGIDWQHNWTWGTIIIITTLGRKKAILLYGTIAVASVYKNKAGNHLKKKRRKNKGYTA